MTRRTRAAAQTWVWRNLGKLSMLKQTSMLERFQGRDGLPTLMDALRRQALVDGSSGIADMIASAMQLKEYQQGEALFQQGHPDIFRRLALELAHRLVETHRRG